MRAVVTHRSVLINAQRYAAVLNGQSERPGRPPWSVLPQGSGLILAASCQIAEDVQVLMVDPRAYGRAPKVGSGGGGQDLPPYIDRTCKIQAPGIVTAICALPEDSAYDAAVATVEGKVYVLQRDARTNYADELDAWSEFYCVYTPRANAGATDTSDPKRIRALAPLVLPTRSSTTTPTRSSTTTPTRSASNRNPPDLPPIAMMDDECVTFVDPGGKHRVLATYSSTRFTTIASYCDPKPTPTPSANASANAGAPIRANTTTAAWQLAIGDAKGCVTLLSSTDPQPKVRKVLQYGCVRHIHYAENGTLLVCGDDGCVFVLYSDGKVRKLYEQDDAEGHSSVVTGVAMRGRRVLSAGMDGRLVLWGDNGLGEVILERPDEPFWALQWSEDNIAFVAACIEERGRSVLYRVCLNSRPNLCTPPS